MAEQLHRLCDPVVKHFRGDLDHDRDDLAGVAARVPFIAVARTCGTDLAVLRPASDPVFPPMGERVPFLFGSADRDHVADAVIVLLELNEEAHKHETRHWFACWGAGVVRRVRPETAMKVARVWRDRLRLGWDRERKHAGR